MTEIICLSVTPEASKVFEELRKIKPDNTSFSKSLRLIVEDYIKNKSNPILIPRKESLALNTKIEEWRKEINEMEVEDFIKLQKKISQINNLVNKRVEKCLK